MEDHYLRVIEDTEERKRDFQALPAIAQLAYHMTWSRGLTYFNAIYGEVVDYLRQYPEEGSASISQNEVKSGVDTLVANGFLRKIPGERLARWLDGG